MRNKNVLIIISAGIAAYKIIILVRLLIKKNNNIKVVMTPYAKNFVSPLVLSTLSKNPVFSEFYSNDYSWNNHVDLALWADLIIVAPATSNTIAKMANAQSDNLAIATYLSAKSPVFIAPAMDLDMYKHIANQENINKLKSFGNYVIPAVIGELASGLEGEGRMAEPQEIINYIEDKLYNNNNKNQKTFLITAGPTYEPIDPVRFIGNHSSGKMGFAIAQEALNNNHKVILISGPTHLDLKHENLNLIRVQTAKEMYDNVIQYFDSCDIVIKSAAVADYKPKIYNQTKIKKEDFINPVIELEKNIDILSELGKNKTKQFIVGFALETNNELENAKSKLERKNLDMIILNSMNDKGAGFKTDTNKISIISKENNDFKIQDFVLKSKEEVAKDIIKYIENKIYLSDL